LSWKRHVTRQCFGLDYFWYNLRVYFLEPARWGGRFPFVHEITMPPEPTAYAESDRPFGVLTNIPLVWLALAVPLAWRNRPGPASSSLRWFVAAVALQFGIYAVTLGFYFSASFRYEADFLPALLMLAVVGVFGLERALADRPLHRRAVHWGWVLLAGFSVAFNLLVSTEYYAEADYNLAVALQETGKIGEAIGRYEQALRLKPDFAEAHYNLGLALVRLGRLQEAMGHWEQSLRIKPDFADAHYNLGNALARLGRVPESIAHYRQAVRIEPNHFKAHYKLAVALEETGKIPEAIEQYEQALRLKPDFAEAHYNLGHVLADQGKTAEAIEHYQKALDWAGNQGNTGLAGVAQ
jgi:tetratricopeptide (TPR) repeat protein